jgi:hypothetical protein
METRCYMWVGNWTLTISACISGFKALSTEQIENYVSNWHRIEIGKYFNKWFIRWLTFSNSLLIHSHIHFPKHSPPVHLLTFSPTHPLIYMITHSLICSPLHLRVRPFTFMLTYSIAHLFTYMLTHSIAHNFPSLTHSLICSPIHLHARPFTFMFTHSLLYSSIHLYAHLFHRSPILLYAHLFIYMLAHSLTCSSIPGLTHSLTYSCIPSPTLSFLFLSLSTRLHCCRYCDVVQRSAVKRNSFLLSGDSIPRPCFARR